MPEGTELHLGVELGEPSVKGLDATWEPLAVTVPVADEDLTARLTVSHWDFPEQEGKPRLTFVVHVPANTPSGQPLYLTGSDPELGAWSLPGLPMGKRADGTWVARADLSAGSTVQYKVTGGDWGSMERSADGKFTPNRTLDVGSAARTEELTVAGWMPTGAALTGDVRYHRDLASTHLATKHTLIVYLPPGYEASSARYPVLYLHDGQNLMDRTTSFAGEWHADEIAEQLITTGLIEPVILVGIYNAGTERIAEYTPVPNAPYGGGNADAYGQFLVDEVKPLVDATYRTRPDAASTGLAGSSLGGLVSTYLGLTHSDVFGRIGAVSPSVWWANRDIVGRVSALGGKLPLRVWIDIGTKEGSTPDEEVANAKLLRDTFAAEGWVLGTDLAYFEAQGAPHNEGAWAARFESGAAVPLPAAVSAGAGSAGLRGSVAGRRRPPGSARPWGTPYVAAWSSSSGSTSGG